MSAKIEDIKIDINKLSKKERFERLSTKEQRKFIEKLSNEEAEALYFDWDWNARPAQLPPPGQWLTWLLNAGRGFGKTRTGAEWLRWKICVQGCKFTAIVAATKKDIYDTMINGPSGILAVCPPWERPTLSKDVLIWPNGAKTLCYSAEEPSRLRGPNFQAAWVDELAAWRYPETWDQLQFTLRLTAPDGSSPQVCATTTPRPIELIKDLIKSKDTHLTSGSTFDNTSNLDPTFLKLINKKFGGTKLGRQELYAEILDDNENALWTHNLIEKHRVKLLDDDGNLIERSFLRIVVAIDPAVTSNAGSDMTGIVVAGKAEDGEYYVIEDLTMMGKPNAWATVAINAYYKYSADKIVAEANNGGDMIEELLRNLDPNVSYKKVHATRGKILRAEPVSAMYEQGHVHHIGLLKDLEDQMCNYTGLEKKSPDRLDALVWAITELADISAGGFSDFINRERKKAEVKRSLSTRTR